VNALEDDNVKAIRRGNYMWGRMTYFNLCVCIYLCEITYLFFGIYI
jgi:hypothetical protein